MQFRVFGATALAVALVAHAAAAHELACRQELNGQAALVLDNYPAAITAVVMVRNVHPTSASVATSFTAPFLSLVAMGLSVDTPFTLDVGEMKTVEVSFEITSQEECLRLARPDGIIVSTVAVGWELGEAQCNAELICKPQRCEPTGVQ